MSEFSDCSVLKPNLDCWHKRMRSEVITSLAERFGIIDALDDLSGLDLAAAVEQITAIVRHGPLPSGGIVPRPSAIELHET